MRAWAVPVALVLLAGLFAGCVNTALNDPERPTQNQVTTPTPVDPNSVGPIKVLAALDTKLSTTAAKWVEPGSTVNFAATQPAGAKGTVTFLWAVGATPGTATPTPFAADTGSKSAAQYVKPGESKSIKFTAAGAFLMHCHPHPYMKSNVTVLEGYTGPSQVTVKITDGSKPEESRFVPENIVIGVGTTVVYENVGQQPHTATLEKQDPPLKKLASTGSSADVTLDGNGWQRVSVFVVDSDGRFGSAFHDIYVAELPAFPKESVEFEFVVGGLPDPVQGTAQAPKTGSFVLERNGTIYVNFTAKDAAAANGAPENLAQVDVHIKANGAEQDTMTSTGKSTDALSARAVAGSYGYSIAPKQGAEITGTLTIEVVYDLEPPAPAMAAPDDGHGGHAH